MHFDMKQNPYRISWWDETVIRVVIHVSRNDVVVGVLALIALVLVIKYPPSWDFIFGLR